MSRLPGRSVSSPIFRICFHEYDPWSFRDWSTAGSDGTWGYRWDDGCNEFRVLYAGQTAVASFVETLQRFVPPPEMLALRKVTTGDPEAGPDSLPVNIVPHEYLEERVLGRANVVAGSFADVARSEAVQYFRERLAPLIVDLRLRDFDVDLSALFTRAPRYLTQAASRVVFEDSETFAGIWCPSRMGIELENVTLFEAPGSDREGDGTTRAELQDRAFAGIDLKDPDLYEALGKLNLELG